MRRPVQLQESGGSYRTARVRAENLVSALKLLANQQTGEGQPCECARRGFSGVKQFEVHGWANLSSWTAATR